MKQKANWTLDDIPWDQFERGRVSADIVAVVRAASLVERNASDYATYLRRVFAGTGGFEEEVDRWAREEIQHGDALARWARLADPSFDFARAFAAFTASYRLPLDATASVRGSRTGELIARCVVESGTSSFYTALREATTEPVLREVCRHIASDEFRHYKLFHDQIEGYLRAEKVTKVQRALVALVRFRETEDDELALAFHCANTATRPYSRRRSRRTWASLAFRHYRFHHVQRAVAMMVKAAGLDPRGLVADLATRATWIYIRFQARRNPVPA